MTPNEANKTKQLRKALATEASKLSAAFALLGQSRDTPPEMRFARLELDLLYALIQVLDFRLTAPASVKFTDVIIDPDSPPEVVEEQPESTGASSWNAQAVLAMDLESSLVAEFPSVMEAARVVGVSGSLVTKAATITTPDDWAKGPEYLAATRYLHTKGWGFIFKNKLEAK